MIWAMPATQPEPNAPHGPLPTGGTVRPITRWGTPPMHTPQSRVTEFDDELRSLVADMVATMYAADGVGLAACQIGVDRAVVVFDCPDAEGDRQSVVEGKRVSGRVDLGGRRIIQNKSTKTN